MMAFLFWLEVPEKWHMYVPESGLQKAVDSYGHEQRYTLLQRRLGRAKFRFGQETAPSLPKIGGK